MIFLFLPALFNESIRTFKYEILFLVNQWEKYTLCLNTCKRDAYLYFCAITIRLFNPVYINLNVVVLFSYIHVYAQVKHLLLCN